MIIKFIVSMGYLVSWSIFMIVTMRIKVIFESAFIDIANMVDRSDLEGEASPIDKIVLPSSFDEMLECAKNFLPTSLMFVLIL